MPRNQEQLAAFRTMVNAEPEPPKLTGPSDRRARARAVETAKDDGLPDVSKMLPVTAQPSVREPQPEPTSAAQQPAPAVSVTLQPTGPELSPTILYARADGTQVRKAQLSLRPDQVEALDQIMNVTGPNRSEIVLLALDYLGINEDLLNLPRPEFIRRAKGLIERFRTAQLLERSQTSAIDR